MAYDIYKLSSQIETLATKSTESSAEELRQIAQKLEEAVEAIVSTDEKTEVDDFKDRTLMMQMRFQMNLYTRSDEYVIPYKLRQ